MRGGLAVDADAEEGIVFCEFQRLDDAVGFFEACGWGEAEYFVGLVDGVLDWGGAAFVVSVAEAVDLDLFAQGYCEGVASRGDRETVLRVLLVDWYVDGVIDAHRIPADGLPGRVQ